MTNLMRHALGVFLAVLLAACSSAPAVKKPPAWDYEQAAIRLHLVSDPQLNLFQKKPHSLILCLYHLSDPNAFQQLTDEKDGLTKLLECSRFDPSVTLARRIVVQPSQEVNELLDRSAGAKYVGVVAGYYQLQKQGAVRSYAIPVTEVERGSVLVQEPGKLEINLYLGRQKILESRDVPKAAAAMQ